MRMSESKKPAWQAWHTSNPTVDLKKSLDRRLLMRSVNNFFLYNFFFFAVQPLLFSKTAMALSLDPEKVKASCFTFFAAS